MEKEDECCLTQLIDGDGTFNAVEFDNFIKQVKLGDGRPYTVVAIMGPVSSGKSTLLNHIFHTNFKEMDAFMGRSLTTKGIWISKCADDTVPLTIVMDLEGTNSIERGEDDTFEKQSARFAFAVSDTVLINVLCHDIGRGQAPNEPLLKTVFQDVLQLLKPRKRTLMFVIRDQMMTPLEKLESVLREDIKKIWDSVPKPEAHKLASLSEFFDVQFDSLPNYELREEFKNKVANLRQRSFESGRLEVVPALEFSSNAHNIWNAIKENKTPDAHKRVKPNSQLIKVLSNLKKIADLGIKHVDLMKDSVFHSLSSVTKGRESSATLILALCKRYDQNRKGFQLNEKVFFSFCTKEVADIIGMEDRGISFKDYETQNKHPSSFPSFVKGSSTKGSTISVKKIKEKLSAMKVEDDDAKQDFRRLMTFYLIEEVLICNRNKNVQGSLWWMVSNLDACESVNWAKATDDHLHRSMKEAQTWLEKADFHSGQHNFIGATPVLEAILYEGILDMRPSQWADVGSSIQKWKPHRRDNKWMENKLSKLTSTSILPCKHCSGSSGSPRAMTNENFSKKKDTVIYPSREAVNIEGDVEFVQDTIIMKTGSEAEKDGVIGSQDEKSSQEDVFKDLENLENFNLNPEVVVPKILSDFAHKLTVLGETVGDDDSQGINYVCDDDLSTESPKSERFVKEVSVSAIPEESHITVPTCSIGKIKHIVVEDSEMAQLKSQQKQIVKLDPQMGSSCIETIVEESNGKLMNNQDSAADLTVDLSNHNSLEGTWGSVSGSLKEQLQEVVKESDTVSTEKEDLGSYLEKQSNEHTDEVVEKPDSVLMEKRVVGATELEKHAKEYIFEEPVSALTEKDNLEVLKSETCSKDEVIEQKANDNRNLIADVSTETIVDEGNGKLMNNQDFAADLTVDSCSLNSLDGTWGSVSVFSTASNNAETSQLTEKSKANSTKSNTATSDAYEPPSFTKLVEPESKDKKVKGRSLWGPFACFCR